ncbi:ABC transporter substrate-binding protein [Actinomyces sp. B33]|uniref:ABC transporter substrate-binding protein n=1 Tax=Actinomyces sp. B33 TaxID=2942131 RepID=UPI00233F9A33|nr:ABC transporter substrate-binding protein [Actinomyces sp. B33]MDC4233955.1 ABC transporter substrate-binding protein [Actinomyces sp. B33]
MRRSFRPLAAVAAASAAVLALGACSGPTGTAESTPSDPQSAAAGALPTITEGKLTFATSDPAYSPWILDNDPASGEGYESAVAYAVAEELGYSAEDVVWTRATFDSSIAPGAKDWDLNLQQFSITDERKAAVDFSSPYYTTSQAIIASPDSPAVGAASIADLKDVLIGVQAGTTSQQFVTGTLAESLTQDPQIFNSSDDTVLALQTGKVDAIVVDVPTAFNMVATQIDNGVIVGEFAETTGGDSYGIVLPKGSALTAAVTAAVDALRDRGVLDELQKKWLTADDGAQIPVLK